MFDPTVIDVTTLLDNTSDAVVVLDASWCYLYINTSAEKLLRRRHTELLGKSIWDCYPELRGTPAELALQKTWKFQVPTRFEQFLPGLYAWHAVRAVPDKSRILLFSRDITDRVRALRDDAVKEGIRNILEDVPVAITITRGAAHRIELQNGMSRQILNGRNVEGMTVVRALPEVEQHGLLAILDEVYASRKTYVGKDVSLAYDRDNSGILHHAQFDLTYQPIFETDGKVSGILHMGVDVTQRSVERALLERYAAERDAILRQLTEGVILTDASGRITFVNAAADRLHGVTILDVDVENYAAAYQLLTIEGSPHPTAELPLARAVLHQEAVLNARWRIRRRDGTEILVEGSAQPIIDSNQRTIACALVMRQIE